jgi:small ligand-binding sensory domain FIST
MPRERGRVRLVSGIRIIETSTVAQIGPNGSNSASIGANGIRHAARDVTIGCMPIGSPFIVTVIAAVVIVVIVKHIPAVRENGER